MERSSSFVACKSAGSARAAGSACRAARSDSAVLPSVCRAPCAGGARHPAHRHGKVTLVTLVAILGLIVLAGFVGNAGHVVTTKVNTQNAADSVTFSSAQWMARGMNAATATNHLLGETTGLVVIIEALGGPETDEGMELYTPQNRTLDGVNSVLKELAPAGADTPGIYGERALGEVEKPFLKFLADHMIPTSDDKGKSKAWATIYDSKLQLKLDLSKFLLVKTVANLGYFVPPPWGYISAAIAYAAHLYSDVQLLEIGKEWFILEGLEFVVRQQIVRELKGKIETLLIPTLAAHGEFVAGKPSKNTQGNSQASSGIVNVALGDSLLHLGKVYDLDAFIYPTATSFRLPVEPEPGPSMKGTPAGQDEKEWGKDEVITLGDADDTLKKIEDNINDSKSEIQARMRNLRERIALMNRLEADVNQLSQQEGVTPEERRSFDDELTEIRRARAQMQKRLADLEEQMRKLNNKQNQLNNTLKQLKDVGNSSGNLSAKRTHLALANQQNQPQMSQAEERYTQWVRATFPYVDSFRAPVLKMFDRSILESLTGLKRSGAAKHYEKWTNRYTLTKAWQFRSGYRFTKTGDTDAEWQKKKDPLAMYVMKGAYDRQPTRPGSLRRDRKGHELWTQSTEQGKKLAEEFFTVIGMTHRDIEPLFSPIVYPLATNDGITTFAQAIYYNNNEQNPGTTVQAVTPAQAKIGWDTLNWDPASSAPEWGTKLAVSDAAWPWDIFTPSKSSSSSAKVKLNWQAKLMPVTLSRFDQATKANILNSKMRDNLLKARLLFNRMVTH